MTRNTKDDYKRPIKVYSLAKRRLLKKRKEDAKHFKEILKLVEHFGKD